jgi:hypothetical protein
VTTGAVSALDGIGVSAGEGESSCSEAEEMGSAEVDSDGALIPELGTS